MPLNLSQVHLKTMQTHAECAYPDEGCGLLIGHFDALTGAKVLVDVVCVENAWKPDLATALQADSEELSGGIAGTLSEARSEPASTLTRRSRYWIDPEDLLRVQREARDRDLAIIGVFHSHPDHPAVPSACDRTLAWSEYSYIIVSVQKGKAVDVQNWQLDETHQFQPEPMKMAPASAATDRMPPRSA